MSTQTAETVLEYRGEHFIQTTWNGISVLKHERTGYYKASKACEDNNKLFADWRRNKSTKEYLEACSEIYQLPIELSDMGIPISSEAGCLLYHIRSGGNNAVEIGNQVQGYYIHPNLFHDVCYWANKRYAASISHLMNLLNERNHLMNQTLEETIENLNKEINDLKSRHQRDIQRLDSLQEELVSRADIIDEQSIIIDEYNKPFNQIDGTPSIYALAKDSSHFQLRVDPFGFGTNGIRNVKLINATFIRDEVINILKNESLVSSVNREYWIPIDKLDYAFNLINEIKNNTRIDLPTIEKRNEFIDKKLQTFRTARKSTQTDGLIFEYETIKSHSSYIPWKLIPKAILNTYGEQRKDRGIDAVEIENNEITKIIQIKKHNGGYLRRDELQTFIAKCSQERYSKASKLLIVKNAKISNKLRRELADISIEIISIQ